MIQKIKHMRDKVKEILLNKPKTRDNDFLLILKVWAEQNPELRDINYSFVQFAIDFRDGKYAHPETIRRNRPYLQNKYPELRGKLWYERKNLGEQGRLDINKD